MNIRTRLTLIFFSLVVVMLSVICISIYFFSDNYRKEDFYRRLKNRATNTAQVLTEVKEVNADLLKRMERNNPASLPNQYIAIYNYRNEELYSSDGTPVVNIDTALLNRIRLQKEISFKEGKVEALGFLFADRYDRFTVVAAATDVYGRDALANLRNVLVLTFSLSLLLVSVLGWVYAGRVLSPISKIVSQVSEITEVNMNRRLDEGNQKDELSKLSQTFNSMLERLQAAFLSQKNFIANASHEIKTPITIMTSEIDVSLLQPRNPDYYVKVLRSVLGGLRGLNDLTTQLLLLAQTSASEPKTNFTMFRIDDALWEMKEELLKAFPKYKVDIDFDLKIEPDSLSVFGDEHLVKVAILNLMDNGCKYSDDNRTVIQLEAGSADFITLRFVNLGKGIDADELTKIFDPFFRGKGNLSIKGSGIGLSLVKRIVSLHRGAITVRSVPGEVTEFTVRFPVRTV
ncbi:HAMP domain-containing sensor histidine kinase [Chryseolinea lacunae]|uniref:histidine kinase n=1 Tax=Chryseolinea lacunae TaxID=2801331 RepID=A0ABS1KXH4_9BACT|nr:HAMP domain-containing sensor histidine kinase [Chryseolinea lacunae]MBL0744161.1 HAMP domain-containing histidine kinase [Chryseolinea lacunae]